MSFKIQLNCPRAALRLPHDLRGRRRRIKRPLIPPRRLRLHHYQQPQHGRQRRLHEEEA